MLDARYEQLRHAALHARGAAFPLGLGVLASKGITAWRHALAALAPVTAARAAPAARPAEIPAPVAAELISALAAVALATTGPAPLPAVLTEGDPRCSQIPSRRR